MHSCEIQFAIQTLQVLCARFVIALIVAGLPMGLNKRNVVFVLGACLVLALLTHLHSALAVTAGADRSVVPFSEGLTIASCWTKTTL
jgi:hypothetical protein